MHPLTTCVLNVFLLRCVFVGIVANAVEIDHSHKMLTILEPLDEDRLHFFAPVSSSVENQLCRNHSEQFLQAVKENKLWAVQMLDASTKAFEGMWVGNLVQLGNYDECLSVQGVPSPSGNFSGQHCLVSLGARNLFSEMEQRHKQNEKYVLKLKERVESNIAGGVEELVSNMGVTVAMCIPSSCSSRDLEQHLRNELRSGQIAVMVDSLACSSSEDKIELHTADYVAIALLCCIFALIAVSTTFDIHRQKTCGSEENLMTAFSLYTNGRKLLKVSQSTAETMTSFSGVRVLSIVWVAMIHTALLIAVTPTTNLTLKESVVFKFRNLYITHGTLCVEPFFILSGLLVCYNFMREREKHVNFNIFKFYFHRYIRLTPPYAMMMVMVATLVNYLGEGPWWKVNMDATRTACERNWVFGLLYVNNYYPGEGMCMGSMAEVWYLAADMQLFLLSPLLLYPLWRYPKLGKTLLGLGVIAGVVTACVVPYVYRIPFSAHPAGGRGAFTQYHVTHTRFTPWLLGVGLGYILHLTKNKPVTLSRAASIGGWILALLVMNVSFLPAYYFYLSDYVYEPVAASMFTGLSRPGFALGVAWIIFACVKGYGGKLNVFLSSAPMQVLGRLSYTVYLSHITVLRHFYASIKTPVIGDELVMLLNIVSKIILCFGVAAILHLAVEAPVLNIDKILFQKKSPKQVEEALTTLDLYKSKAREEREG